MILDPPNHTIETLTTAVPTAAYSVPAPDWDVFVIPCEGNVRLHVYLPARERWPWGAHPILHYDRSSPDAPTSRRRVFLSTDVEELWAIASAARRLDPNLGRAIELTRDVATGPDVVAEIRWDRRRQIPVVHVAIGERRGSHLQTRGPADAFALLDTPKP